MFNASFPSTSYFTAATAGLIKEEGNSFSSAAAAAAGCDAVTHAISKANERREEDEGVFGDAAAVDVQTGGCRQRDR